VIEGDVEKLGRSVLRSKGATGRQATLQQRVAMVGACSRAWTTCRPFTEHVACSEVGKAGAGLCRIRANSDFGPKMKFDLPGVLYSFHVGTMVIRAVD